MKCVSIKKVTKFADVLKAPVLQAYCQIIKPILSYTAKRILPSKNHIWVFIKAMLGGPTRTKWICTMEKEKDPCSFLMQPESAEINTNEWVLK